MSTIRRFGKQKRDGVQDIFIIVLPERMRRGQARRKDFEPREFRGDS